MSTEAFKAKLRSLDDEVFNKGNMSIIDEVVSTDFVNHDPFLSPESQPDARVSNKVQQQCGRPFPICASRMSR